MGTVIKRPVPDWVKPSFVIFDIRALWLSGLSVKVLRCQKCWCQSMEGSSDGWAKTSWAKDVWANYFLGDRRLGDKLGRYGDSKSDGWATFSDGWAKCVKEEKLKTSDTIKRQMCARM